MFIHLGVQIACSVKQTKGMFKFSPSVVYFGDMLLELIIEQVTVISQKKVGATDCLLELILMILVKETIDQFLILGGTANKVIHKPFSESASAKPGVCSPKGVQGSIALQSFTLTSDVIHKIPCRNGKNPSVNGFPDTWKIFRHIHVKGVEENHSLFVAFGAINAEFALLCLPL
jgi:hypothetical protein